jgi:hypothetical protein
MLEQGKPLGNADAKRMTIVSEIYETLDRLNAIAAEIGAQVHGRADSFYGETGPSQERSEKVGVPPVRGGALGGVDHRLNELQTRLEYVAEGVRRFRDLA